MTIPPELLTNLPAKIDKLDERLTPTNSVVARRKRKLFIEKLRECGNMTEAASAVGYSTTGAINYVRRADPAFAQEVMQAMQDFCDKAEGEVKRRGVDGVLKPKYHQGVVVGFEREYSDTLLLAFLKAHRPKKWGDNKNVEINHTKKVGVVILASGADSEKQWEMESVEVHEKQQAAVIDAEFEQVSLNSEKAESSEKEVTLEDLL